jgi:hypothetical protein
MPHYKKYSSWVSVASPINHSDFHIVEKSQQVSIIRAELRAARFPLHEFTRKRWVKTFQVLATISVVLREQIEFLSALVDENTP